MHLKSITALCLIVFGSTTLIAQTWNTGGNSVTGDAKFGTTSNTKIDFITNNTVRGTLSANGLWGFGTANPSALVHIQSPASFKGNLLYMTDSAGAANKSITVEKDGKMAIGGFNYSNAKLYVNASTFNTDPFAAGSGDYTTLLVTKDHNVAIGYSSTNIGMSGYGLAVFGNTGIGTNYPKCKLHVSTPYGSSGLSPNPNALFTIDDYRNSYINLLTPSGTENGILFGAGSAENGGIIYNNPTNPKGLQFRTGGNATKMVLTSDGKLGVGTFTPQSAVHISRGSAGITPYVNASLTLESNIDTYINLLTPYGRENGILFGSATNAISGGIIYNSSATLNGLQFRTAGNITRMVVNNEGRLGVNTFDPGFPIGTNVGGARAEIMQSSILETGLRLALNQSDGYYAYELWNMGSLGFALTNGQQKIAVINPVSGAYYQQSDARLKKDIEKAPAVLPKVLQLTVDRYHFLKSKSEDKKSYGLLAQEVEKLFPEVVQHISNKEVGDFYTMDYSAFGVLAIKAIQELVEQKTQQDKKINQLQKQIDELKTMVFQNSNPTGVSSSTSTMTLSNATLEQNTPNPFAQTTIISYTLPQQFTTAQIVVTDNSGRLINRKIVSGSGKGAIAIDAAMLSAGTYTYSLFVDGRLINAKQMTVGK